MAMLADLSGVIPKAVSGQLRLNDQVHRYWSAFWGHSLLTRASQFMRVPNFAK